ncbi:hypothetical protein HN419_02025 [Candidatus Woesearchaeota archaeon]|nr:hypothetical protein [Candidatus Woesearchaeota archaeon]MBT7106465.1 hypothetical protein [Candidatus Woesearchaeota archaeon]
MMWILRIIYLILVVTSIVLLIKVYAIKDVKTQELEATLFINRVLQSPGGLCYYDSTLNRVVTGVIDANRFSVSHLNRGMNYGDENKYIAAKFVIAPMKKPYAPGAVKTLMYNPVWYDRWAFRADTGAKKEGGAAKIERFFNVIYREQGVDIPAKLNITVVLPNE